VLIDAEPRNTQCGPSFHAVLETGRRSLALLGQAETAESLTRLENYVQAHLEGRESQHVRASIALVLSSSMRLDPSAGWSMYTHANVSVANAAGSHDDVIGYRNIDENAPLLRRLLLDD
jgi:thioesterase domain-containing protein